MSPGKRKRIDPLEQAMKASEKGDLSSQIELRLKNKWISLNPGAGKGPG